MLSDRYGDAAGTVCIVGFWAAAMSSLVGVWNGVSLMFTDFPGHVRGHGSDASQSRAGGTYYKAYVLWLLNSRHTPPANHNGWLSNAGMVLCTVIFASLAVNELVKLIGGYV